MSTITEKELAAQTGFDVKIATGETLDLKSQGTVTMPAGAILQVVQGTYATETDTTSTSFINLGLNASITPSSTSSKILIVYDVHYEIKADNRGCGTRLNRDSTALTTGQQHEFYHNGAGQLRGRTTYHYLDSPSSTSAINYSVQVRVYLGEIRFCNDNHPVQITLMEVAG